MSNMLSVRRVKVQTLDENGNPDGEPTFGVMAADNYDQSYNDTFMSFEELNKAINKAGCILDIIEDEVPFSDINSKDIGTKNFYGKVDVI